MKRINTANLIDHNSGTDRVYFDLNTGDMVSENATGTQRKDFKLYSMKSENQFVGLEAENTYYGFTFENDTLYYHFHNYADPDIFDPNELTIANIRWGTELNIDRIIFATVDSSGGDGGVSDTTFLNTIKTKDIYQATVKIGTFNIDGKTFTVDSLTGVTRELTFVSASSGTIATYKDNTDKVVTITLSGNTGGTITVTGEKHL